MASKSVADNDKVSGTEDRVELKEDIAQIENPSAAGPSGVKAEDYSKIMKDKISAADDPKELSDIDLGNGSGSSDTGSLVHHQAEGNGLANLPPEDVTDPADTIRAAHEAANAAREAAASCRKTLADSSNAIENSKKRIASAKKKSEGTIRRHVETRYRSLSENCLSANELVVHFACVVGSTADIANATADNADTLATQLAEAIDLRPETVGDRQQLATSATNTAKINAAAAYKSKYQLLKAMKKCWEAIDSEAMSHAESSRSFSDDKKCVKLLINVFAVIAFVAGCAFLAVRQSTKCSPQTCSALLTLGIIMLAIATLICVYRLWRCTYKRRKAAERKRRQTLIANIEADLRILDNYFEINHITPVHSSSEEEEEF